MTVFSSSKKVFFFHENRSLLCCALCWDAKFSSPVQRRVSLFILKGTIGSLHVSGLRVPGPQLPKGVREAIAAQYVRGRTAWLTRGGVTIWGHLQSLYPFPGPGPVTLATLGPSPVMQATETLVVLRDTIST